MPWIIEGTLKYQSDTSDEIIHHANSFKIFERNGEFTWTQEQQFKENFSGIGDVLTEIVDALNKSWYPKQEVKN